FASCVKSKCSATASPVGISETVLEPPRIVGREQRRNYVGKWNPNGNIVAPEPRRPNAKLAALHRRVDALAAYQNCGGQRKSVEQAADPTQRWPAMAADFLFSPHRFGPRQR